MNQEELKTRLLSDLAHLNLPVDEVDLFIRPFSKTLYGRYFPVYDEREAKPRIFVYPYENTDGDLMSYDQILGTSIHEFCHHIQYTNDSFIRNKGVMHDTHFWKLYNHYLDRAKRYQLIGGETCEKKEHELLS